MAEPSRPWYKNVSFLITIGLWVVWLLFANQLREMEHPWDVEGEPDSTADFVAIGGFYGGLALLIITGVVLATHRWWLRWALGRTVIAEDRKNTPRSMSGMGKWYSWIGLAIILVCAASIRGPMMNRPVLRDEQDNLRRNIFGFHYIELHHRDLRFLKAEWQDAFFENRLANNPIFFSVLSKASLKIWKELTDAPDDQFSKIAFRMPSLIFGLGSIVCVFIILAILGRPFAGLLGALLAALHPLHIEYSIQARGYGIVMFCVGTAAICGILAFRRGRWRYWIGFAFSLLGILYAFAGGIYFVLPVGLVMAGMLFVRWIKNRSKETWALVVRFSLTAVMAGTIYAALVSPSLPQISRHLSGKYEKIPLHPRWLLTTYTQYTSGIWIDMKVHEHLQANGIEIKTDLPDGSIEVHWADNFKGVGDYLTTTFFKEEPIHSALIFLIMPVLAIIGFVVVWRHKSIVRWFAVAAVLAPILDFSHHQFITGLYAYFWYWIYSLLWLLAFIALGLCALGAGVAKLTKQPVLRPIATAVFATLFFALYIWETKPGRPYRNARSSDEGPEKLVFPRGRSDWVIYQNGYQLRVRQGEEIPETFSGLEEEKKS